MNDSVNHPKHYTSHPSGIECIQITEHMGFNLGNAVKYIWRADLKSDNPVQDLQKAVWYLNRQIEKLSQSQNANAGNLEDLNAQACALLVGRKM